MIFLQPVFFTIPAGQAVSNAVNLGGSALFRLDVPATWAAANITVQTSPDAGVTWFDTYDEAGNAIVITAGAARSIVLAPDRWYSMTTIRLRSGTSAAPVNQAAQQTLPVLTGRLTD